MTVKVYERFPSGRRVQVEKWEGEEESLPSYIDYAKAFLSDPQRRVTGSWVQIMTKCKAQGSFTMEFRLGDDGNLLCVRASNYRRI